MGQEWGCGAGGNVPMHFTRILEQSHRNTMHRRIAPSLVEEPARSIQVVEVILVSLTAPETHIRDLEVAPEMAGRVAVRFHVMLWSPRTVAQPIHRVVLM